MSYGLEVWNSAGVKTMSTSDRVSRFVGQYVVQTPSTTPVAISVPGMRPDGTWSLFVDNYWMRFYIGYDYFTLTDVAAPNTSVCIVLRN